MIQSNTRTTLVNLPVLHFQRVLNKSLVITFPLNHVHPETDLQAAPVWLTLVTDFPQSQYVLTYIPIHSARPLSSCGEKFTGNGVGDSP